VFGRALKRTETFGRDERADTALYSIARSYAEFHTYSRLRARINRRSGEGNHRPTLFPDVLLPSDNKRPI